MGEKVVQLLVRKQDAQIKPRNRINDDLFKEIVSTGIGWMAKNSEATVNQVKAELIRFYYPEVEVGPVIAAAVTAYKLYKQRIETEKKHREEWEEATAATEIWFTKHSDLRHPAKTAQDILNELKPNCGLSKLTAAVAQAQEPLRQKKKDELWKECLSSAEQHFAANPGDKSHPGQIAEEINRLIAEQISEWDTHPYRMLTAAVARIQKRYQTKKRDELSASGVLFMKHPTLRYAADKALEVLEQKIKKEEEKRGGVKG